MNESYLQNLSHSMVMTLLEAPWLMMKLFNASTFTPATRRTTPTIGCSRLGQRVRMRTSSDTALDGGEARVEPALHQALLHEPVQLPLGQHRMHEVHLPKGLDVHLAQPQGVLTERKGKGVSTLAVSRTDGTCSQWYCSSRSLYSVVRSACVTPSMESMIGQAKS